VFPFSTSARGAGLRFGSFPAIRTRAAPRALGNWREQNSPIELKRRAHGVLVLSLCPEQTVKVTATGKILTRLAFQMPSANQEGFFYGL